MSVGGVWSRSQGVFYVVVSPADRPLVQACSSDEMAVVSLLANMSDPYLTYTRD